MVIDMDFLNEVARDLPIIRPIKEFIHLNLLLPYQHLPFWEALDEVRTRFEAHPFPDLEHYRKKIQDGDLPLPLLRKKLEALDGIDADEAMKFIMKGSFEFIHHDSRMGQLHECWNELVGINIIELSDGMLIKWLSMFMDQGIGHWQMPEADEKGFYHCIQNLLLTSLVKPRPFSRKNLNMLFPANPEEAITRHLEFLCPDKELRKNYVTESIMTLRGWAGLIYNVQKAPHLLPFGRKIDLIDFLALKLVLERAWIEQEMNSRQTPQFPSKAELDIPKTTDKKDFLAFRACQEALEEATYEKYIKSMVSHPWTEKVLPSFQAVFCMDDRETPLRRHLENASHRIETFGTPGHFGIDCLYHHPDDVFPKKQCPAPTPAKVLLKDIPLHFSGSRKNGNELHHKHNQPADNLIYDWFFSYLNAPSSILKLTKNMFFPLAFKSLENVQEVKHQNKLKVLNADSKTEEKTGLPEGYTIDEMANLIFEQLQLIGFIHHFAPLVFILGHGSNSENNPYFATYGCGACSGRSGAANARAFVEMANNPQVRQLIKERHHLEIPHSTHFVACFHDTTRDTVEIYDMENVPVESLPEYHKFKKYLSLALYKNAKDRTKAFKLVTYRPVSKEAQKEVIRRSYSLFETRPELGHTGVAFAIAGRKEMQTGSIPGHPAFHQSYDPTIDPDGRLLTTILGALVPVCSGINLDYFFSRVDNLRFGAGSKLPQNIVGNFGVSHGTESDLLFGLPFQMIDQHQPLRLMVLVEQEPHIALSALQSNPMVRQIVYNSWLHYACYDYKTDKIYFFENGQMILKEKGQELL